MTSHVAEKLAYADADAGSYGCQSVRVAYSTQHGLVAKFRDGWFACDVSDGFDDSEPSIVCDTTLGEAELFMTYTELDSLPVLSGVELAD